MRYQTYFAQILCTSLTKSFTAATLTATEQSHRRAQARKAMPHFFLHVRTGDSLAEDFDGQDFTSLADARDEAVAAAREIMSDRVRGGKQPDHSQVEIVDEAGHLVHIVPFEEALRARI